METISQRLAALREELQREHLGAFIFPSTDPHQSEYVADHWKGREWISGFNGSAGTAVVTMNSAALWTDSRYFLAAEEQLRGTEFQLMKLKLPDTPTIAEWLGRENAGGGFPAGISEVGIDGTCSSASMVRKLAAELRSNGGLTLRTNFDPLVRIWSHRPPIPTNPVEIYPIELAGESTRDKIKRIRQALREKHADGMLMASLDDIAWTLNLRGTDVHCNPVFVSYLLISTTSVTLYIDKHKLSPDTEGYLRQEGVEVAPYEGVAGGLRNYFEYNILMDPEEVNHTLFSSVKREVVEVQSPVKEMKAVKNAAELAGFRKAMERDGVAMVRFLRWLLSEEPTLNSEISVAAKLEEFRAQQPLYRGLSFDTISAYGIHGAIVHYEPTPESDIPLQGEGLLLLDSGAQYLNGTTDITRTIALGPLTTLQRQIYTLVLKGHLRLQAAIFPEGTTGTQIDAIAREPLWRAGLNYLHGTGHGVGAYLCVHEGPHQIRMEWKPTPLQAGMTITDEPGIYLAGLFGVRIENTLMIVPCSDDDFTPTDAGVSGRFLRFEPLTLCPIDTTPIIIDMLTDEERRLLNNYHRTVCERLSPLLNDDEAEWLRKATAPV